MVKDMSDPVTNVEIEDVLSSIRKLVSVDDRPAKKADDVGEERVEKLVLTPSLRVDEGANAAAQNHGAHAEPLTDEASQEDAGVEEDQNQASGEDVFSEEAARHDWSEEDRADANDGDDGIQDAEIMEPESAEAETAGTPAAVHDDASPEDTAWSENDDSDDAGAEPHVWPDSLTARVAEFERAVAGRDDGWEPDGSERDDNAAEPTSALPWQDHDSPDSESADDAGDVEDTIESAAHDPFRPSATAPRPEDDSTDEDGDAARAEAASINPGNAFLLEEDLLDDGDDAILDEEMLRDLVADIVRQELQGALGERITRNVRKLVRREIHRALAAQELE